jgi:hypothetical protein
VALPLLPPKQETLVEAEMEAVTGALAVMVVVALAVHPFASVTVTV